MRNSCSFVKMLGMFVSVFIYILSCLGAYINLDERKLAASPSVNYSTPFNDLHVQHESSFNVNPALSVKNTNLIDENRLNHLEKMTFENEIPISMHAETKRLINEPSAKPSNVSTIYLTVFET